ncbi:MAG: peptidase M3, partial [Microvirga sp.]
MTPSDATSPTNPFLREWTTPFTIPPFETIAPEHFKPAFDRALGEQLDEIAAIAGSDEDATFANTIEALERSGALLKRVGGVFFNLSGAHTNEAIQAVEREMAPLLAKHRSAIYMNGALFRRVEALHGRKDAGGLTPEQARVLDRYHTIFVRAGARLEAG